MSYSALKYQTYNPIILSINRVSGFTDNNSIQILWDETINNRTDILRVKAVETSIEQITSRFISVKYKEKQDYKKEKDTTYNNMFAIPSVSPQLIYAEELRSMYEIETKLLEYPKKETLHKTLDFLFDTIEEHLISQQYELCNKFLEYIDIEKHDIHILIGLLTVSLPWKNTLFYRANFYKRVQMVVHKNYPADEAADILEGLE